MPDTVFRIKSCLPAGWWGLSCREAGARSDTAEFPGGLPEEAAARSGCLPPNAQAEYRTGPSLPTL